MVLRWKFDLKKAQKDRILVAPSPTRAKGISNSWGHFCVSTMFDMAPDFLDSLHTHINFSLKSCMELMPRRDMLLKRFMSEELSSYLIISIMRLFLSLFIQCPCVQKSASRKQNASVRSILTAFQ